MGNTRRTLANLLSLVLFCAILNIAALGQDATASLKTIYGKIDQSIVAKDASVMAAMLTKDFVGKEKSGEVSAKESIERLKQAFAAIDKFSSSTSKIEKVEEADNEVTVLVTQTVNATLKGPDGAPHEMVIVAKSRDKWVHEGDDFKLKFSETMEQSTTIDGKKVDE
ncbi:MAG: nuclear transport factor 2 family protein [Blastocatellia bacterium]|nr:nuclear transport factor 2 family protein [Blastocatellia bacterium]